MPFGLIDSHIHLDDPRFDAERESLLQQAKAQGVVAWVVPATSAERWPVLAQLQRDKPHEVFCAYGLHPWFLQSAAAIERELVELERCLRDRPCVGVGECGLDGYEAMPAESLQWQALAGQVALAKQRQLPLILHARRSLDPLLKALRQWRCEHGVVHGFVGSPEQAMRCVAQGLLVGIGGAVTYPRAKKLQRAVQALPLSSLVLETDGPHQPARGYQGQLNPPQVLLEVLHAVAELKGVEPACVAWHSHHNTRRLFGLP